MPKDVDLVFEIVRVIVCESRLFLHALTRGVYVLGLSSLLKNVRNSNCRVMGRVCKVALDLC